jgi:MFS family permease
VSRTNVFIYAFVSYACHLIFHSGRNHPDIDEEIQVMSINRSTSQRNSSSGMLWHEFKKPQLYKPLIIMILFFTIQQFSGIFTIFIYAAQFSIEAGVSIDEFLCTVIIGLIRCFTVIIVSFASDKYGRKPLATISTTGMFISMLGLVVCSIFNTELKTSQLFWLPTALLFFFIFSGTFGVLTLPFAMIAEVYPQNTRGLAVGLTIFYAYIMSFANVKTFTAVFSIFGSVTVFSFYGIVSLLGIAFAVIILPETKGKSLHEIELYFQK